VAIDVGSSYTGAMQFTDQYGNNVIPSPTPAVVITQPDQTPFTP
jgi:hypothetical protein